MDLECLRICADSLESLLLDNAISTKIVCDANMMIRISSLSLLILAGAIVGIVVGALVFLGLVFGGLTMIVLR